MSTLNFTDVQDPREARLKQIAASIKNMADSSFAQICEVQKAGINLVWNMQEFTPQEIINALGQDAIKIFQYHGKLTELITNIATVEGITPDIQQPTNAFTIKNGTITVTNQPYQG